MIPKCLAAAPIKHPVHYDYAIWGFSRSGTGQRGSAGDTSLHLYGLNVIASSGYSLSATLTITDPNSGTSYSQWYGNVAATASTDSGFVEMINLTGRYHQTTAFNSFRILPSTGTVTANTIKLFGVN